jgi:hypothetical protein
VLKKKVKVTLVQTLRLCTGRTDRKSGVEGKSVVMRVDLGGRRIIKKKIEV